MPKAGRYDYPSRDLDDCVEYLRKAFDTSKSYVMTRDSFATAISLSSKGGGFNLLIGSMSMFGLVDTGGGEIRYTELAKKILFGEPDERHLALEDAVRKIGLFAEVYDKYGAAFTDDQLRLFLKDKAVVDIAEANSLAQVVGKSLKSHLKYLTPRSGVEKKATSETQAPTAPTTEAMAGYGSMTTAFGTFKLLSHDSIKLAHQILDMVDRSVVEEPKTEVKAKKEPTK